MATKKAVTPADVSKDAARTEAKDKKTVARAPSKKAPSEPARREKSGVFRELPKPTRNFDLSLPGVILFIELAELNDDAKAKLKAFVDAAGNDKLMALAATPRH